MAVTLRQLEIFEKVANCGNVTQASRQLHLTQSAVSMAIAELERFADAPLFERQGRRLLLNDRGRHLLPQAGDVLAKVQRLEQFLNESTGEPVGTLNVGASTTIGNYLLPAVIGEFSLRWPKAKALLFVGNAQQIEQGVANGEYDLGLSEGYAHIPALESSPWRPDELVVVVGREHTWAKKRKVSSRMLEEAAWLMREVGSGTREVFEAAMQQKDLKFSIAMELGHTEAIKKAVEAGLGVGCLSRMAVQRELDQGWLIAVDTPLDLRRTLIILTRSTSYRTRLLQTFIALLEKGES